MDNRPTSIQKINDAEMELIKQQSALLLQKRANGFNGELKSSGAIIENYIKGLLSKHLPKGYRICSGYIATADSMQSDANLIQHDIIIFDERIPPIHSFGIGDIEVVCAESVCGIIEVKRTLTKDSLKSAIGHLRTTKTVLDSYREGIKSKSKLVPEIIVCPTMSIGSYAPFYAIIALDCNIDDMNQEMKKEYNENEIRQAIEEFIDLIWVPAAGWLAAFMISEDNNRCPPDNVSRNQGKYSNSYMYVSPESEESNKSYVYSYAIALYRTWISHTSGKNMGMKENAAYLGFK